MVSLTIITVLVQTAGGKKGINSRYSRTHKLVLFVMTGNAATACSTVVISRGNGFAVYVARCGKKRSFVKASHKGAGHVLFTLLVVLCAKKSYEMYI